MNEFTLEIWKDIKGYEGLYRVSYHGRVWNTLKSGMAAVHLNLGGYAVTALSDLSKKQKVCTVHRLVAEAFLNNPLNKPQIHHIDENRQNNHFSNLQWVTALEHGQLRSQESKDNYRETYRSNLQKRKAKFERGHF